MARVKRDIISVEEAVPILGMSKRVIWERIREGHLPAFHIGHRVYMRRSEIDEYLRAGEPKRVKRRRGWFW